MEEAAPPRDLSTFFLLEEETLGTESLQRGEFIEIWNQGLWGQLCPLVRARSPAAGGGLPLKRRSGSSFGGKQLQTLATPDSFSTVQLGFP